MTAARARCGRTTATTIAVTAALLYLAQAVPGQGWAACIAFIPLLLGIHPDQRKQTVFLTGLGAGAGAFYGSLFWITTSMRDFTALPFGVALLVLALLAAYLGSYLGLFALLIRQWPPVNLTNALFLAGAWTLLEYLRGTLFGGFPWHLTGLSLALTTPVKHLLPLAGAYGLTLFVGLINTAAALVIHSLRRRRPRLAAAGLLLLLLPPMTAVAAGRLQSIPAVSPPTPSIQVAVIQPNIPQQEKWAPEYRTAILAKLERLTATLPPAPPDSSAALIVWPEATIPLFLQDHPEIEQRLARIATDREAYLLVGILRHAESGKKDAPLRFYNSAILFGPDGGRRALYDKHKLVPYGEFTPLAALFPFLGKVVPGNDFSSGSSPGTMSCDGYLFAPTICFEGIFPGLVRRAVAAGGTFLVNITNDAWFGTSSGPAQHLAHTRLRALEHRQYLVRGANTGISAVIAPDGSLVEHLPLGVAGSISATIHPARDTTFYTRYPHAALLTAGLFLLPGLLLYRKG
jgi:apolipoprotein N-acyltransferase